MRYLQVAKFLGLAVVLALAGSAVLTERALAQTVVEITAEDLRDDTAGADPKKAYEKVNAKIAASSVTGGTVVTFPEGEFKDVGEIQVFGKSGTASSGSGATAVAAKYIALRGRGTVFTGKIMINVQGSKYIVIEGFTFRDTQVLDAVTVTPGAITRATDDTASRVEDTGVVWLNTAVAATSAECSTDAAMKPLTNITVRDNVFMNTAQHGILARAKNSIGSLTFHARCDSSAVTVRGNRFVGIGLGPNAVYLDAAKTVPGFRNRESAIEGDKTYGWTVTDNMIGVAADGMDAKGTTANGIRLDRAFGKTVVSNNTVNNTAWSGIVVGGDGSSGNANIDDADEAEITIANNKVTNSRNDPYIVSTVWVGDTISGSEGYSSNSWRFNVSNASHGFFALTRPPTGPWFGSTTKKTIDDLLDMRVCALGLDTAGVPFTLPWLGPPGSFSCRLLSSIITYTGGQPRLNGDGDGDGVFESDVNEDPVIVTAPGRRDGIPSRDPRLRWLRPGLEAGLELNRLTAKTIMVENNELTDNVVGLAVCPSLYCYADDPFPNIAPTYLAPAYLAPPMDGTLKVPTIRNNSIYGNDKATDLAWRFVRADVVNALTEDNTGDGKATLVLVGNYLGDDPRVRGSVNTDDLADVAPESVGPQETDDPGVVATGGATLSGTTITLMYDEALDEESVPVAAAFTVVQADSDGLTAPIGVTGVSVSGMSVTLTLAKAPGSGNSVAASYDPAKAGSGTGRGPIRDVVGNEAPALTSRTVTASMPTPMPMPTPAADDGGCALASGGSGGADLGMLLAMMVAPLAFGLRRRAKEAG